MDKEFQGAISPWLVIEAAVHDPVFTLNVLFVYISGSCGVFLGFRFSDGGGCWRNTIHGYSLDQGTAVDACAAGRTVKDLVCIR